MYNIKFTDINKLPNITINKGDIDTTSVDIALFGRLTMEYGELLNESLLHILENFNCPQDLTATEMAPDLSRTANDLLYAPIGGQLWYNSTAEQIYFWSEQSWIRLSDFDDVSALYGTILDGEQIPTPISSTGKEYTYAECIWSVSPKEYSGTISYMKCYTDDVANVTVRYILDGDVSETPGIANFLIIGIRGNINLGTYDEELVLPPE